MNGPESGLPTPRRTIVAGEMPVNSAIFHRWTFQAGLTVSMELNGAAKKAHVWRILFTSSPTGGFCGHFVLGLDRLVKRACPWFHSPKAWPRFQFFAPLHA